MEAGAEVGDIFQKPFESMSVFISVCIRTECHGSYHEALGGHAHVDQVHGHFGVPATFQLPQSVAYNGEEASHSCNNTKDDVLQIFSNVVNCTVLQKISTVLVIIKGMAYEEIWIILNWDIKLLVI